MSLFNIDMDLHACLKNFEYSVVKVEHQSMETELSLMFNLPLIYICFCICKNVCT